MDESQSLKIETLTQSIRASFEAGLSQSVIRASQIQFMKLIPGHWFSTAASECIDMFVAGQFYGAISISQAYVEALGRFLADSHKLKSSGDFFILWQMLVKKGIVTLESQVAAVEIFDKRHDFHHLNKKIETDYQTLEARALGCINNLYVIESHVFDYGIVEGKLYPTWPRYWPASRDEPEHISVNLRNI